MLKRKYEVLQLHRNHKNINLEIFHLLYNGFLFVHNRSKEVLVLFVIFGWLIGWMVCWLSERIEKGFGERWHQPANA